jgi:threonine dehydrogenase-like Zn-dependent dehydrogenase
MRAAIRRAGRLVCDTLPDPVPEAGQVLVRTLCCGICGSDLHALHHFEHLTALSRRGDGESDAVAGPPEATPDIVFGHEFSVEVLDHGPGGPARLAPGTLAVSVPVTFDSLGVHTLGYSPVRPGGFAERMVLSDSLLLAVPNGLSAAHAATTEPFAVGAHAVAQAQMEPGAVALVVGCGPVGLAVIASLKARGHGPVVAADFSPRRRAAAEAMGADLVLDPARESAAASWAQFDVPATGAAVRVARMAGRRWGRPVVFECVGSPGVLQSLIETCPSGARIVVAGVCMQTDRIEPSLAIVKQLSLEFVFGYSPDEFAHTLRDIAEGLIDPAPLLTGVVGLDGVADAFAALASPDHHVKILVEPGRA